MPESKSVARAEGSTWNEGDPDSPCRTNCESQAGKEAPPQRSASRLSGVGLAHSSQQQGASPEAGEGANSLAKLAQATRTVRMTDQTWQTSLWAKTTCQAEEPGALCGQLRYVVRSRENRLFIGLFAFPAPHNIVQMKIVTDVPSRTLRRYVQNLVPLSSGVRASCQRAVGGGAKDIPVTPPNPRRASLNTLALR